MKNFIFPFLVLFSFYLSSQCVFDESCTITPAFPNICPQQLPNAVVGEFYTTDLTFWMPVEFQAEGFDVFRFVEMDTQLVEVEDGMTENESVTRSVRSAIEAAVYELILQGDERGFWTIKWPVTKERIADEVEEIVHSAEIVLITEEENKKEEEKDEDVK